MKRSSFTVLAVSILLTFTSFNVYAGVATDRIKTATDKLIEIVSDHDLDSPEMADERERMIRETVDTVFDWVESSRRALGKHWKNLSKEERKEFTTLFGKLIERTYMDRTRQYSGEKMTFLKEETEGRHGSVEAKVIAKNGAEIFLKFHIIKRKETWFVYDVFVEGLSLVKNYREQFNSILAKPDYNYNKLLADLKNKLEK